MNEKTKVRASRKTIAAEKSPELQSSETYSEGAQQILIAAEKLFGEHGIEGVSIRQILIAAGHGNKAGVAHHFGSKEGLVQAVFDMRMLTLDRARQRDLNRAIKKGDVGMKELLAALMMPILEEVDAEGQQTCARFMFRLIHRDLDDHPLANWRNRSTTAIEIIDRRMRELVPHIPDHVFMNRLKLVAGLILLGFAERPSFTRSPRISMRAFAADIIEMGAAAMQAPYQK